MLAATVLALFLANGPLADWYRSLHEVVPLHAVVSLPTGRAIHLSLTLAQWVEDGVLAIFFFVVGLELKREIVVGELRRPSTAVVPIVAAIGGVVLPALTYLAVNAADPEGSSRGWAVPTATDIAFALAVLAVVGRRLPSSLRAFLLTLAIVDDLIAITIIAVVYPSGLDVVWLVPAAVTLALVGFLTHRRVTSIAILFPLAALTWLFVHESGIHATIAGVALGLVVPATRKGKERRSPVEHWEHIWGPVSAAFAVPLFALFAAGVVFSGSAVSAAFTSPESRGIILGLVVGKPVGILLATMVVAGLTRATLPRGVSWWDVVAVAVMGGIGFTVSLLIGDLAFGDVGVGAEHAKAAVLLASIGAAAIGSTLLAWRDRHHGRRLVPSSDG